MKYQDDNKILEMQDSILESDGSETVLNTIDYVRADMKLSKWPFFLPNSFN